MLDPMQVGQPKRWRNQSCSYESPTHEYYPTLNDSAITFENLLRSCRANKKPVSILITGPSGSGKSTLAVQGARSAGFRIVRLCPRALAVDDAGSIEGAISEAFSEVVGLEEDIFGNDSMLSTACVPVAIIIDELDVWAPAKLLSSPDVRFVAALREELSALHDESHIPVVFIATALDQQAVHPSLFGCKRTSTVISLHALAIIERGKLSLHWLSNIFSNKSHDELRRIAERIAVVTPGFMHGDMTSLFSTLERAWRRPTNNFSSLEPHDLLSAPQFWDSVKMTKPSLLSAVKGTPADELVDPESINALHGLDSPIKRFQECLTTVFRARSSPPSADSSQEALQQLGICKGLILYGATGCGKSAIARLASQTVTHGSINILCVEGTSIMSSIVGDGERRLSGLFATARAIAPTVVVIENVDVLAPSRGRASAGCTDEDSASEAFNRILGTFLTEIDGTNNRSSGEPVFLVGTTRSLDLLDDALLRPGRFEIHIPVCTPDSQSRKQILNAYFDKRVIRGGTGCATGQRLRFERFTEEAEGWSAPMIQAFGREMLLEVARELPTHDLELSDLGAEFSRVISFSPD